MGRLLIYLSWATNLHVDIPRGWCNVRPVDCFPNQTAPPLPLHWCSLPILLTVGGWVDHCGWIHTNNVHTNMKMIIHLLSNQAQHRESTDSCFHTLLPKLSFSCTSECHTPPLFQDCPTQDTLQTRCVALKRRNTTGPPCSYNSTGIRMTSSPGQCRWSCLQACRGVIQTPTDDDDSHQRPLLVWPPAPCVRGPVIIWDIMQ